MTKSLHYVNHYEIRLHHIATDHHLCNKNGWLLQEPVTFVISLMMRACPRWAPFLLPSATKLRRLYFHRRLSVHRGGCLLPGEVCSGRVPGPGGLVSQHALRQIPLGETTTAADGTHPTGMHSCCLNIYTSYFFGYFRMSNSQGLKIGNS